MMQVKGSAIASMTKFITDKHGDAGLKRWLDALTPQAKQVYSGHIMANNWYSLREIMVEPTAKMCELFYHGDARGAWEAGKYSADFGLTGFYKIFVKVGSPDFIFKRASTIMAGYYSPCQLGVTESGPGKVIVHITQFSEPSAMVEARIGGWIQRALEIHGCKNVSVKITKSLTKGDSVTEYTTTWN
ncbi:MAG: hypothetical protein WBZ29_02665 [Methanocella sp.]